MTQRRIDNAVVALAVSSLLFNPWGFDRYQLPRLLIQGGLVIGVLALGPGRRGVRLGRVHIVVGALLAVMATATLASFDRGDSWWGSGDRRFGLLQWLLLGGVFVVGQSVDTAGRRRRVASALVVAALPVAVLAVCQRVGLDPFDWSAPAQVRPVSTVGNASMLGGLMALVVVLACGLLLDGDGDDQSRRTSALLACGGFAALVTLALSQARGAWLGAACGVVMLAVGRRAAFDRRDRRRLVVGAVGVLVAIGVAVPGTISRLATLTRPTEGTAGGRLELLRMGMAAIGERPLLGWGPDMGRVALHRQIGPTFEARFGDSRIEDRAHNMLVDVGISGGLLAVLLMGAVLVMVVAAAWRHRGDGSMVAYGAAAVAFAVHWMFNFGVPDVDVTWWLLAGALTAPATSAGVRVVVPRMIGDVAAGVGSLVLVLSGASLALADWRAARAVAAENAGDVVAAERLYRGALGERPDSAVLRELAVRFYGRVGLTDAQRDQALRLFLTAGSDPYRVELAARTLVESGGVDPNLFFDPVATLEALAEVSPFDGSVRLSLGTAYVQRGDIARGEAEYLLAAELVPQRSEPSRNLGLLAEQRGDTDDAIRWLQRALEADPTDLVALEALGRLQGAPPPGAGLAAMSVVLADGSVLDDSADPDWLSLVTAELDRVVPGARLAPITVKVTIIPERQAQLEDALTVVPSTSGRFAAVSVAVDVPTGAVVAAADSDQRTSLVPIRRPTGSVLKFLVAAAAFDDGVVGSDVIDGRDNCLIPTPQGDVLFAGSSTMALGPISEMAAESVNCAFAKLYTAAGADAVMALGEALGLTGLGEPTPRLVTGSAQETPLELAGAMSAVLGDGSFVSPWIVAEVTDASGEVIYTHDDQGAAVLSADAAAALSAALGAVVDHGTAAGAALADGRPAAAKTGTQDNNTDAWIVGGTPQLSVAVWMGNPASPSDGMTGVAELLGGNPVDGGTLPAAVWKAFLDAALAEADPVGWSTTSTRAPVRVIAPGVECTADEVVVLGDTVESVALDAGVVACGS